MPRSCRLNCPSVSSFSHPIVSVFHGLRIFSGKLQLGFFYLGILSGILRIDFFHLKIVSGNEKLAEMISLIPEEGAVGPTPAGIRAEKLPQWFSRGHRDHERGKTFLIRKG